MAFANLHRTPSRLVHVARHAAPVASVGDVGAYDLLKTGDDRFALTLAVPGFSDADLQIETKDRELVVRGTRSAGEGETVLHRGLRFGSFERRFALAEHVRVDGARLHDGLLTVDLVREVPEALRPRTIAIDKAA